ncbi:MAG TPA: hypothetical protein VNV66_10515, partial [Pilimelia sp.]|nr:hypothetical protein [Pilimelia sp.]
MATRPCSSCGERINPALTCPACGAPGTALSAELSRLEREIAAMSQQDLQLLRERTVLSKKMQAALHQRAILANAADERRRAAAAKQRRPRGRRRTAESVASAATGPAPAGVRPDPAPDPAPGAGAAAPDSRPPGPVPPTGRAPHAVPRQAPSPRTAAAAPVPPPVRPEASWRSVQNIMLGLGALLLAVAAIVFAALAISTFGDVGRVAILAAATTVTLLAPRAVVRRGLRATAETIAAVGLLLVPVTGYALWTVDALRPDAVSDAFYTGLVLLVTAGVSAWYARVTGLIAPRYAAVLALQPVLPLLAYPWVSGPIGWSLVLTAVAAADIVLARLLLTPLAGWPGGAAAAVAAADPDADAARPGAGTAAAAAAGAAHGGGAADGPVDDGAGPGAAGATADADGAARRTGPDPGRPGDADRRVRAGRPEGAPEEPDAVLTAAPRTRAAARPAPPSPAELLWLRDIVWVLHG